MNSFVACPHCRQQVGNDGSLSGQVVSCPHCRGQFTMPGIAVAPVVSAPAPFVSVKTVSTSARQSPRKNSLPLTWIAGGTFALLVCCGVVAAMLSNLGNDLATKRKQNEGAKSEQTIAEIENETAAMKAKFGLKEPDGETDTKATYHGFIAVKVGMTVSEVEAILGVNHEAPSEKTVDGQKVKLIVWHAADVTADYEVLFLNGEVFKTSRNWRK